VPGEFLPYPICRNSDTEKWGKVVRAANISGLMFAGAETVVMVAPERGGLPCSSAEAGVMLVERRGQVIAVGSEPTGNRRSSNSRRKVAAFVRWQ
jgi:hypothetical protein